ncbi:hypothetical protein EZS27_015469 [termite gut metagenome]|uniref:BACON domain-containing protein n=1 Tax=termite gut metagenome TaxID=433724 RepID=A0A5J4RTA6_9ZZZZ
MTRKFLLLTAIFAGTLFSCEENDKIPDETPIITIDSELTHYINNVGGEFTIDISSNAAYGVSITGNPEWLTVIEPVTRAVESSTITLKAEPNTDPNSREAIVVVKDSKSDTSTRFKIIQNSANPTLVLVDENGEPLEEQELAATLAVEGGSITVHVNANVPFDATVDPTIEWIEPTKATDNKSVTLTITPNVTEHTKYVPRSGTVYFTSGDGKVSAKFTVTQNARQAGIYTVIEAGQLEALIFELEDENVIKTLQNVTISGPLNDEDFNVINSLFRDLSELDLSGAELVKIPDQTFEIGYNENGKLRSVILPEGLKEIGKRAFYGNKLLSEVVLPNALIKIDANAFADCDNLTNITIPSSLEVIGSEAFKDCDKLGEIIFAENSRLDTIDAYAFYKTLPFGGGSLSYGGGEFVIPNSVRFIGDYAFCQFFKDPANPAKITLGSNVNAIGGSSGSLDINGSAFRNNDGLIEINIPGTIKAIPNNTFQNTSLTTVIIENGVETIGDRAFSTSGSAIYKPTIKSVTFPASLKSIGAYAFDYQIYLREAVLPAGATYESNSFNDIPNISITIQEEK